MCVNRGVEYLVGGKVLEAWPRLPDREAHFMRHSVLTEILFYAVRLRSMSNG